jgi:CheY-like chemotaxis protein
VIIALTANAREEDREVCMKAGMDDYISKPIELNILISKLEYWSDKISATNPSEELPVQEMEEIPV